MFDILRAIFLGIVEGITEFLPISSTGHLIVAERLVGFNDYKDLFTVVIQVGAIAAVIWFYRHDLWKRTVGLFKHDRAAIRFWTVLATGTLPAALIGLALDNSMEKITTPLVVAVSLIIGGIILWLVDRKPVSSTSKMPVELGDITTKQAALIGLGQSLAIIPGVSRSGATIVSGLATGLSRPTATAFSFYLSIPVLVAASGLKLVKYHDHVTQIPGGWAALLTGLIAAFITALFAISWLLKYIASHNFTMFAYYRIIIGIMLLIGLYAGWL